MEERLSIDLRHEEYWVTSPRLANRSSRYGLIISQPFVALSLVREGETSAIEGCESVDLPDRMLTKDVIKVYLQDDIRSSALTLSQIKALHNAQQDGKPGKLSLAGCNLFFMLDEESDRIVWVLMLWNDVCQSGYWIVSGDYIDQDHPHWQISFFRAGTRVFRKKR